MHQETEREPTDQELEIYFKTKTNKTPMNQEPSSTDNKETVDTVNEGDKLLNNAEILCIIRLRQKGNPLWDIAQRIGITVSQVKRVLFKHNSHAIKI